MKNKDLLQALEQIGQGYQVDRQVILEALEVALTAAAKKITGQSVPVRVEVDEAGGRLKFFAKRKVVERPGETLLELSVWEARETKPDARLGEEMETEVEWEAFGRIAAQTVRQVVLQRMREVERDQTYDRFKDRAGELVSATILRFEGEDAVVDIGGAEALFPRREQMYKETLQVGDIAKFYVLEVRRGGRAPQVIVSRTHPGLLKRLMEIEIPEVADHLVEIRAVGREPGYRAKVAVQSKDKHIDPVGTCVGPRAARMQAISRELQGEKIDVLPWSDDLKTLIAHSVTPARVVSVETDESEKRAVVLVPDDELSLAIGKKGQNARLVSKLTGWRIDIKSEARAAEERREAVLVLAPLADMGEVMAARLVAAGLLTPAMLASASPGALARVEGMTDVLAAQLKQAAKAFLAAHPASGAGAPSAELRGPGSAGVAGEGEAA